ncbi:hypothetical protein [Polaribacter sp.]|uniref:hypothetical protein n=1 Tax=Polaribacter sp. TaxID=1920175 RepID=UPI00404892E8
MKKTKLLLLIVGLFLTHFLNAQDQFIGIYRIQNKGCGDYVLEQKSVKNGVEFEEVSKDFKLNHKEENPTTYFVKATDFAIVYEFVTHLFPGACKYKEIRLLKGSSLDKIRENSQDSYTRFKGTYVTAPQEIAVFNGVEINDVDKKNTTKEYTHLTLKIIPQKKNENKAFAAQFVNKHLTKALVVKIKTFKNGNPPKKDGLINHTEEKHIVLQPGAIITQNIGEADFYELLISDPQDYNNDTSEIDFIVSIKNWTKQKLTKKELDNPKTKMTSIGGRG